MLYKRLRSYMNKMNKKCADPKQYTFLEHDALEGQVHPELGRNSVYFKQPQLFRPSKK
ncbi:hypothetical protein KIN20_012118 [Parelaphostrongylus tenuis]|uniref:Uncharacterized protein n=1 Tax=Parelaphostrongylus tenuis TaxID=148309 RepID=A0AAD5MF02_PARTN|nr:hypothetical protein KIN20_012118 [Parelaphostrongylus tenuis]